MTKHDLNPPDGISHFAERCRQRGIKRTDPVWIGEQLRRAATDEPHDLVLAEHVIPCLGRRADIWRFRVVEGIFYAAVTRGTGRPRTILTQEMVRKKKWVRKQHKRGGINPVRRLRESRDG